MSDFLSPVPDPSKHPARAPLRHFHHPPIPGQPLQEAVGVDWGPGFTSVCISIPLLLAPCLASSQRIGRVLGEEGDDVAATGSQGGVQRGGDTELDHRPGGKQGEGVFLEFTLALRPLLKRPEKAVPGAGEALETRFHI